VGGQLVQVHCWERGASPNRPTDDGDAVLDVRAKPDIVATFTQALVDEGFRPAATSATGIQHRWLRDEAVIDVLIPRGLGQNARVRTVLGGRPIATPGAQNVLHRAERVEIVLPGGDSGSIWRPTLQGALLAKSFAITVALDLEPERHLVDLAVLSTMIAAGDFVGAGLSKTERNKMGNALVRAEQSSAAHAVEGGREGLARLRLALS
jgi:hypothetical protein